MFLTEEPVSRLDTSKRISRERSYIFIKKEILNNATIASENTRGDSYFGDERTARLRVILFNYFVAMAYVY